MLFVPQLCDNIDSSNNATPGKYPVLFDCQGGLLRFSPFTAVSRGGLASPPARCTDDINCRCVIGVDVASFDGRSIKRFRGRLFIFCKAAGLGRAFVILARSYGINPAGPRASPAKDFLRRRGLHGPAAATVRTLPDLAKSRNISIHSKLFCILGW
ncbi:hypothetical protein GWI33_009676 [Rhynchophorus ferrugineus]|uniref:Uncharacterized protein n=1 Tax=Rhynchophorus ferrugineus TaxID=354439 RepID=A0A834IMU2_RHYFE|nr:hypothetical protein GWI33_009676 [Rhynchophorus ferrugineus]